MKNGTETKQRRAKRATRRQVPPEPHFATLRALAAAVDVPHATLYRHLRAREIEGVPAAAPWTAAHAQAIRSHFEAAAAEREAARVSREAAAAMGPERLAKLRLALARAELVELDVAERRRELLRRDTVLAALAAGRDRLIRALADNQADPAGQVRECFEQIARELFEFHRAWITDALNHGPGEQPT